MESLYNIRRCNINRIKWRDDALTFLKWVQKGIKKVKIRLIHGIFIDWFQTTLYTSVSFSTGYIGTNSRLRELVFPWYFLHRYNFYKSYSTLFFKVYQEANYFCFTRKVYLNTHQQPGSLYPSHQKVTKLNDWRQHQSSPNEATFSINH